MGGGSLATTRPAAIPACAGIGLRAAHYAAVLEHRPAVGFLEVHPENYFGAGGKPLYFLEQARMLYPLSLHGVGLSIGSTDPLSRAHLERLRKLIRRFEPALVSEHLCWGSVGGIYHNDLLPLPYTESALRHMAARVGQVQDLLGREILIENISAYLEYRASDIPEWEFLAELARRAGCGLLLDVNNVYVNSRNHGFDPRVYLAAIPVGAVREIHLAGHSVNCFEDGELRIDTHDRPVCSEVWNLYRLAIRRFGPLPTLVEWDADLPPLAVLVAEAAKAGDILEVVRRVPA